MKNVSLTRFFISTITKLKKTYSLNNKIEILVLICINL